MSEQLIKTPSIFGDNGNFLLERELGSGGMGGVYMGRDKMLDRPVAVKVLLKEYGTDAEFLGKFKKEAQAAARLIHPNIVQVYSYGVAEGMPYIAMELAAGGSLYALMNANKGKTDIQRVLKICQQTALALQCATDQGVVHGDVKPENILFDANGNAKLVDFGLAAMQKDTSEIWGTPYYISPEKVKKETIDFRADIYSLGGTLYHALTGVAPFEGDDAVAVVKKRFEGAPKKPSEIRPEITPAIDNLVMTMLELDREKRYPSFEALLNAFREVLSTGLTQSVKRPTTSTQTGGSAGMNRPVMPRRRRMVVKKTGVAKPEGEETQAPSTPSEDEEDRNENLGAKVVMVVIGVIVLVGAIIGGLIWYKVSAAKTRERETQIQIVQKGKAAHEAILENRKRTEEFDAKCESVAKKAADECETLTKNISALLPDIANDLKPAVTKELLEAQALLVSVGKPSENTAEASTTTNANASAVVPSPEMTIADANAAKDMPKEVVDMHELWERVYSCQAARIRLQTLATKIYAECDKSEALPRETREQVEAVGAASVAIKDLYDQMAASKDNETLKKGATFIASKCKNILSQTEKRVRSMKAEAQREAEKLAIAEAARKAKEEAERKKKELIESETAEIAAKFDEVVAQGCFRQLDWDSAFRRLNSTSSGFKSAEGKIAAAAQVKKVERMKSVQELFIKKLPNHVFKNYSIKAKVKHPLSGAKVLSANNEEIVFLKTDQKKAVVSWQKFFRDCPGHLNEAIDMFIVNGRTNSSLNLRDWADAMTGAAMMMRIVCAEIRGATEKAEQLAKDVYSKYEDYHKILTETFPDISFDDVKEN